MKAAGSCVGAAFGLAVSGTVAVHGLAPAHGTGARRLTLERRSRAAIDAHCPPTRGTRVGGVGAGPRAANLIDHGAAGYVWRAPGWGTFEVSADGRRSVCAPARAPAWRWQRMLVGQVLPLAALLQGLEVIHAGAVGHAGGAIAIAGESGAGKSTLVAALVARGAEFLADDVVALEATEDALLAHPGMASTSLRRPTVERLDEAALERLGRVVGGDEHELRLIVDRARGPLALRTLLTVERGRADKIAIRRLGGQDPRPFLAMTFNRAVTTAERLARQFDIAARLAHVTSTWHLEIPLDADPDAVATTILEHAG